MTIPVFQVLFVVVLECRITISVQFVKLIGVERVYRFAVGDHASIDVICIGGMLFLVGVGNLVVHLGCIKG